MKANEFLVYIFLKLIKKEGGINNFFLRCVDTNRKRFFYNDANVGWTEDLMNSVTICLVTENQWKKAFINLKRKENEN